MAKSPRVQLVIDGKDNTKSAFGAISQSLNALEQKTASVGRAMVGAFAGLVSVSTLKSIGAINSEWIDMSSRLRRVTADEEEFAAVTERLGEVAESTWSGLNETIESYLSMQGPLADMGYTTQEQVDFVSALNNALVVSGAKKEVAASVQNALNKAMASGVLRGENLNTVIEKGGRVAELLAQKMGVTVSELRALGTQGKITGDVMYDALAGNMQLLAEEADAMPATFEDAMQRVNESFTGAFRDEDLMEPLADSLLELAEVLKDPAVRQGLASLAAGLAGAASTAVEATSEFGDLGQKLGYFAAWVTGNVSELDKLEAQIKDVDKALNGSFMTKPMQYLFTSEQDLMAERNALEARKEAIINAMTGTTAEMRKAEAERQKVLAEEKAKETALHRKYVNDLKAYNKQALDAVKARGEELAKAEKDAAKKILDAKKEAETLLKQFDDIRKEIAGGGEKEPSYGEYQRLAAMARQALAAGETEKAKENALAAASVLKELAAAGENTFGFSGLVKSMQDVAKSATDIEQANAESELEKIKAEMADLAVQAEALENMPISMQADEASLEAVKSQITALLEQLKVEAVIPVRMEAAGSTPDVAGSTPGFARGGHIRGPGTGTSDSILARLSNGEFVVRAAAVRKYGLDMLHRMNNMQIPQFATGGLVEQVSGIEPKQPQAVGTLNFNLPGGESFSVNTVGDFNEDLRRAALKYGKPRR